VLTSHVLHRSRSDRVVAGVCGGLGEYLGIDPVVVRLGFILLTVAGGIGLPVYLLLAVIMPSAASVGASKAIPVWGGLESNWRHQRRRRLAAAALILLGSYFLLENAGLLHWLAPGVFWPMVLIGLGVLLLTRRRPRYI
jgi:phage shock protein C